MDLIDREQAIKEIRREVREQENSAILGEDIDIGVIVGLKMAAQIIKKQPPAEKTGKWLAYEFGDERWHKCSVCGTADEYVNNLGLVAIRKYCPNCGAKMED